MTGSGLAKFRTWRFHGEFQLLCCWIKQFPCSDSSGVKKHKTIATNCCFVFVISIKYFLIRCVPGIFLFLSHIFETLTPTVKVYNRMITWFGPVVATGDRVLEASTVPQSSSLSVQYSPSTLLSYSSFKVRKKRKKIRKEELTQFKQFHKRYRLDPQGRHLGKSSGRHAQTIIRDFPH